MRQNNTNYLTMAAATIKIIDANSAIWSGNVPFTQLVNFIKADLADINTAEKGGSAVSTGATLDKELAADAAIAQAVKMSSLAQAYALNTNNNTLNNQIKTTTWQLDRYSDNELTPMLQNLYEKLQTVAVKAIGYGITLAELQKLADLTAAFDGIKSNARVIITERKGHNTNIPSLLRHLRANFHKADKLINIWIDNQKFMSDYQNARIVIDLGGAHAV